MPPNLASSLAAPDPSPIGAGPRPGAGNGTETVGCGRWQALAKRAFDVVFAATALLITAPALLTAIVCIRLESRGAALFRQTRMGRDGRPFTLLKLRGMRVDSQRTHPELYDYSRIGVAQARGFYFHRPDDPRVTRVGRILRRYSIDELPNFWNVLRGEMSVVGPRPEIPELAPLYGPALSRILSVRPGVTSPAKATGRDALSAAETIASDLAYIEDRSFRLDLSVVAHTCLGMLRSVRGG